MKVLTKTNKHSADLFAENEGYRLNFEADENRMGILYAISAVLYARDWTIVEGRATQEDGKVKDSFYLKPLQEGLSAYIRKFYILGDLKDLLDEEYSVAEYLSRFPDKLKKLKAAREKAPLEYRIRKDEEGEMFIVDIETADRPGLILDIVRAFYYLYFDIYYMESNTIDSKAYDTFYIRRTETNSTDFDLEVIEEALRKL